VTGGTGAHDYLLFRFLTNEPGGIVGGSPFVSQGGVGHEFNLVLNGSVVGHYGRDDHAGGPNPKFDVSIMPGTTHRLGTIDVMLDFLAVSGVLRYEFSTQANMHFINGPHVPRVLDEFGSMDATLAGLDLVDAGENVLASAAFDQLGNATLDVPIATPEPLTSTLFATGLAIIGLVVRDRRRRAMLSSTPSRRRLRD
jgi:hypothetical protein